MTLAELNSLLSEVKRLREVERKWWALQYAVYQSAYGDLDPKEVAIEHLEPEAYEHDYRWER